MSCKRSSEDRDPDYDDDLNTANDQKRLRVIEKDNKDATLRKIEQIIRSQFGIEMGLKEKETDTIDERLYQAMKMLDQLRACVVSAFYSFENFSENTLANTSNHQPPIHPTVKKYLGKTPKNNLPQNLSKACTSEMPTGSISEKIYAPEPVTTKSLPDSLRSAAAVSFGGHRGSIPSTSTTALTTKPTEVNDDEQEEEGSRVARFKIRRRVVIGNVSKYIPVDKREERDQSTHKWMVYVRGPKEQPDIDDFVKKVWFFLHPSYRPNDLVEVTQPPFHLTRRGWGEFPVRVQLHFRDPRNKRVDIIHTLRLDKTYTGLQTLGAETVVDMRVYRENGLLRTGPRLSVTATAASTAISCPFGVGGITIPGEVTPAVIETVGNSSKASDASDDNSCYGIDRVCEDDKFAGSALMRSSDISKRKIEAMNQATDEKHLLDSYRAFLNDHSSYASSSCSHEGDGAAITIKSEPCDPDDCFNEQPVMNEWLGAVPVVKQEVLNEVTEEAVLDDNDGPLIVEPLTVHRTQSAADQYKPLFANHFQDQSAYPKPSTSLGVTSTGGGFQMSMATPTIPGSYASTSAYIHCTDTKSGQPCLMPLATYLTLSSHANSQAGFRQTLLLPSTTILAGSIGSPWGSTVACGRSLLSSQQPLPSAVKVVTSCVPHVPNMNGVIRPATINDKRIPAASRRSICRSLLNNSYGTLSGPVGGSAAVTKCLEVSSSVRSFTVKQLSAALDGGERSSAQECKQKENLPVDIDDLGSLDDIVRQVVKCFPLVAPRPDRVVHPYCASSLTSFLSWNVGKRRAAEWQRAKAVCKRIQELVSKSKKWTLQDVWKTRRILTWCRHLGYSPLRPGEIKCISGYRNTTKHKLDSTPCLSDASELMQNLEKEQRLCELPNPEDEFLDVEILEEKTKQVCESSPQKPSNRILCAIPSSPCGDFVRQMAEQIGVNLISEEVCTGVTAPAAEEVILSAVTQFAEDIMRQSLLKAFTSGNTTRDPSCIEVGHVTEGILELPPCDFLTSRYLGTKILRSQLIAKSDFKL